MDYLTLKFLIRKCKPRNHEELQLLILKLRSDFNSYIPHFWEKILPLREALETPTFYWGNLQRLALEELLQEAAHLDGFDWWHPPNYDRS